MRIVLFRQITIADSLTFPQASEALQLAISSRAAEFWNFYIKKETEASWKLVGEPVGASEAFILDPDQFVITTKA